MSELWPVNIVSAFGRGETLALALQNDGFDVRVIDFTKALGPDWNAGVGPFPVVVEPHLPQQEKFLQELRPLPRGLTFWLPQGPIELSGPMSSYYANQNAAVKNLAASPAAEFDEDWLRRFMLNWANPYHLESWGNSAAQAFPYAEPLGLIPAAKEARIMSFERFKTLDLKFVEASVLRDIQFEGARITELEVESGRREAFRSPNWIWCLSSEETAQVGLEVAQHLFANKIRKTQWRWLAFQGRCHRGSWSIGFPEYSVVLGDLHLPWVYTNAMGLRWTDSDIFELWLKVPAEAAKLTERRAGWAEEARLALDARLPQAMWQVDGQRWRLCPHSPVFDLETQEDGTPGWKNWDWIAPEALSRLDLSARLECEAAVFARLVQWRADQLKKQGARRDTALHAP